MFLNKKYLTQTSYIGWRQHLYILSIAKFNALQGKSNHFHMHFISFKCLISHLIILNCEYFIVSKYGSIIQLTFSHYLFLNFHNYITIVNYNLIMISFLARKTIGIYSFSRRKYNPFKRTNKLQQYLKKQIKVLKQIRIFPSRIILLAGFFLFFSVSSLMLKKYSEVKSFVKSQVKSQLNQWPLNRVSIKVISYNEGLKQMAQEQILDEIIISRKYGKDKSLILQCKVLHKNGFFKIFEIPNLQVFLESLEKMNQEFKINFQYSVPSTYINQKLVGLFFSVFLAGTLIFLSFKFYKAINNTRNNQMGLNFMKKKFQAIHPQKIRTKFSDVAGMHQAKSQITQFVDFLKLSQNYIEMGAKVPKGALLTGPPGTGKTLLAKACAGEAGVPFFYVSGSDFVQKYVGLGANRVRQLFEQAQKVAPSIIFIDEIDAIGKKRDSGPFANEERDNTLNQLLVKMDGFDTKNKVIVMAATNRKDMLDPALLRPGRFDRIVEIGLPNFEQRKQILKVHLLKVKFSQQITMDQLANKISILTPGFSGAELANVCNEGAILAARQDLSFIQIPQFEKAIERVLAGLQKRNMFSDEQKKSLSYYESGKAVIGWFTQGSDPLIKISILPFTKSSKGYSQSIKDQYALNTKEQLLGKVCTYLAGRASEVYFRGYSTTNGDSDIKKAQRIIEYMVTKYGMSQALKMIAFPQIQFVKKPYSQKTQKIVDEQIMRITQMCRRKIQKMIEQKKTKIQQVSELLLRKETLSHNDIETILGKRQTTTNQSYQAYLKEQDKDKVLKDQKQNINREI